jgi:ferredoxin
MSAESVNTVDLTIRSSRAEHSLTFNNQEIVILATPVYYGRAPEEAVSCFSALSGSQTVVILVVVYGNRAFDDALLELRDIAVERNFIPVAAGAFLAEHSYSSPKYPMAQGRPDETDLRKALEFGTAIRNKLLGSSSVKDMGALTLPGQVPYVEPKNLMLIRQLRATTPLTFAPETDSTECTQCGLCAQVCPTGAISADDPTKTAKMSCIICFACVKKCPEGARQMRTPEFDMAIQELFKKCQGRKEPEVYL